MSDIFDPNNIALAEQFNKTHGACTREIDHLRKRLGEEAAKLAQAEKALELSTVALDNYRAELEAVKAERDVAKAELLEHCRKYPHDALMLSIERDRYRAALEKIADPNGERPRDYEEGCGCLDLAREALADITKERG
jgi:chromosome segregation ATPase